MRVPVIARQGAGLCAAVALSVVALIVIAVVVIYGGGKVWAAAGPSAPPRHPHNASWRYGADQLADRVRVGASDDATDVARICGDALVRASDAPARVDRVEAVAGCRYEVWSSGSD